jgi:ribosomal-protein-alanine N-acetyltransferase
VRALAGHGVILEPQVAAHAPELFALLRDPRLYTWLDDEPPEDELTFRRRLERLESRQSGDGTEAWLNWVVRSAAKVVGYVQATIEPDGTATIAYVIGADHWRRGHAEAATRLMVDELQAAYGARRLRATVDPANAASIGLLHKLGFVHRDEPDELPDWFFYRDDDLS